jgi:maleate isomerase
MPNTLAPRGLFCVLVPWFNTVVEPELADLRPAGVTNQTARFGFDAAVLENVASAAEHILPCQPAALLIGLSTEPYPGGLDLARQGADEVARRTHRPVFTASHATQAALRALGATRIAVVTPFDDAANAHVRDAFEADGFTVVGAVGLACPDLATIGHTAPDVVRRAFREADRRDAEVVVQVGTGLPVVHLVTELEQALAKPVVACNAALYWQALRETGIDDAVAGFGRLLAGTPSAVAR